MGKRGLTRSIEAGRVLTPKELEPGQSQIYACSGGKTADAIGCGSSQTLTAPAMLLDFKPLIDIVKALKSEFEMRPEGR